MGIDDPAKSTRAGAATFNRAAAVTIMFMSVTGLYTTFTGSPTVETESIGRILLAGIVVMIVPGLVYGQVLGVRAHHLLDVLALAVALALPIHLALALVCFLFHLSILWWVATLLAWNVVWSLVVLISERASCRKGLISCLKTGIGTRQRWSTVWQIVVILFLARAMYRWGGTPATVGWEVATQLTYIRQYVSGLPLDFSLCALRPDPELVLPNLFFIWEFDLAGISRIAGIDPLIACFRSRWLVPVLGLSAFYFMALRVTRSRELTQKVVSVTLAAVLLDFFLLYPAPWKRAFMEPYRGVTAFWGSIHHSDTGMEILLPLATGALFAYLARCNRRNLSLLMALLVVCFFWHPREYFQVIWYGAIALLTHCLTRPFWRSRERRAIVRCYLPMAACFLALAVALFAVSRWALPYSETATHELQVKSGHLVSLVHLGESLKAFPPFRFPMMGGYGQPAAVPPDVYSWLVLPILLVPVLAMAGSRRILWVSLFYLLLWWLTLCFDWTQSLLIAFTYSEILICHVRFLPLFSYVLIACGWDALVKVVRHQVDAYGSTAGRMVLLPLLFYIGGRGFAFAWQSEAPGFDHLVPVMTLLFYVGALLIFVAYHAFSPPTLMRRLGAGGRKTWLELSPVLVVAAYAIARLFFSTSWNPVPPHWRYLAPAALVLGMASVALIEAATTEVSRTGGLEALRRRYAALPAPGVGTITFLFVLFLWPACAGQARLLLRDLARREVRLEELLGRRNPLGLSSGMVQYLRTSVPPRRRILVDPLDGPLLGIYAPLYIDPYPKGYIIPDLAQQDLAKADRHPLFNGRAKAGQIDPAVAEMFARVKRGDFIFGGRDYVPALTRLAQERPRTFGVAYLDPRGRDVLIRIYGPMGPV
jgi:hypothetical protein